MLYIVVLEPEVVGAIFPARFLSFNRYIFYLQNKPNGRYVISNAL